MNEFQDEAIITNPPLEMMKSPIDTKIIPIMMGYNSKDGLVMLPDALVGNKFERFDNDLARLIPRSVNLAPEDERCKLLATQMRQLYLNGNRICDDTLDGFVDLFTDYYFSLFTHLAAELFARYQNRCDTQMHLAFLKKRNNEFLFFSPIYFYRFSVDKDFNLFKKFALKQMGMPDTKKFKGAYHTDEIYYLFT